MERDRFKDFPDRARHLTYLLRRFRRGLYGWHICSCWWRARHLRGRRKCHWRSCRPAQWLTTETQCC